MNKNWLLLSLAAFLIFIQPALSAESQTDLPLRHEIDVLLAELHVDSARQLLQTTAVQGLSDPVVLRTYAFLESYIYGEHEFALQLLERALTANPDSWDHILLVAEVHLAVGTHDEAVAFLEPALSKVNSGSNDDTIGAIYRVLGDHYEIMGMSRMAIAALEESVRLNPYNSESNQRLHRLYVEDRRYQDAYRIWRQENFIVAAGAAFLPRLQFQNAAYQNAVSPEDTPAVRATLYRDLGLFEEAALEYERALQTNHDSVMVHELEALRRFLAFRDKMVHYLDEYYRDRILHGRFAEATFYQGLDPIYRLITPMFSELDGQPFSRSWLEQVNQRIADTFGFRIDFITANGLYLGCHFGYIADHYEVEIAQIGDTASIDLVVLRRMLSNGVLHWFNQRRAGVGGWNSSENEIVSVLGSVEGLAVLFQYLEPDVFEQMLQQAREYDVRQAQERPDSVFFSQELVHTLIHTQLSSEVNTVRKLGLTDDNDTRSHLIARFLAHYLGTTTAAHEGRHALDRQIAHPETWFGEYEYRAKLAELAFGTMQHLTLAQFHQPTLGSAQRDTHVRANTEIFSRLVHHIAEHPNLYPAVNPEKNIMMQLPLLTELDISNAALALLTP